MAEAPEPDDDPEARDFEDALVALLAEVEEVLEGGMVRGLQATALRVAYERFKAVVGKVRGERP